MTATITIKAITPKMIPTIVPALVELELELSEMVPEDTVIVKDGPESVDSIMT